MGLLSGFDVAVIAAVMYFTIGLYAARATSVLVNGGLMWQESTPWQKMQRSVLFPIQTFIAFLKPHAMSTPLARLRPSYEMLAEKHPTLYCILLWPLTVVVFLVMLIALMLSAVWVMLSRLFHQR